MHALSLSMLAQLSPTETAADRPDVFDAYSHMTIRGFNSDVARRLDRTIAIHPFERLQLRAALAAVCRSRARLIVYFPPDNVKMLELFEKNDRAGVRQFKEAVRTEIVAHNHNCPSKVALFDFMNANKITVQGLEHGLNPFYVDLVHFRPPIGTRLLRRMMFTADDREDVELGVQVVRADSDK